MDTEAYGAEFFGSANPARSTGVALFVGGWAVAQLWLFWVAPIVGATLVASVYRLVSKPE